MELFSIPIILLSFLIPFLLYLYHFLTIFYTQKSTLPPGPPAIPLFGNFLWLRHSFTTLEPLLKTLFQTHGPILTLHIGSRPVVFISDRTIAHKALVESGAFFSDRPVPGHATKFLGSNQHNISSAAYGPLWRLLRRNLISEILHPSKVKIYAEGRDWVLGVLIDHLSKNLKDSNDGSVFAKESFQFAMFCLLVLMCYGEKLDEKGIREIEEAQMSLLLYVRYLNIFAFVPAITKYLFRNRWKTALEMRERQKKLILPLIEARRKHKRAKEENTEEEERFVHSYLDSLLDIKLSEEGGRGLTEDEMVSLCSEFLNGGTDTTATALQWIMAELVRNPEIQGKILEEIESVVVGSKKGRVREEDLSKMPYLKAVVLEGLRKHPPGHFVLPHAVTEEVEIVGYIIPKNASINFMVAQMGRDEKVWEDPMEFKLERFLKGEGEGVDITGTREIRMMPFGVGRRICPGLALAMLHLEFFVANLVREFEWKRVEGDEMDMSEKPEFITTVMKYPLRTHLIPRRSNN